MARTDNCFEDRLGNYIAPTNPLGMDFILTGTNKYHNWGSVVGGNGYGIRDNSGVMEIKNSGGSWQAIANGNVGGTDTQIQFNDGGVFAFELPVVVRPPRRSLPDDRRADREYAFHSRIERSGSAYLTRNRFDASSGLYASPNGIVSTRLTRFGGYFFVQRKYHEVDRIKSTLV